MTDDILLTAGLDQANVILGLNKIIKEVDKMAEHSDTRMKRMAAVMKAATQGVAAELAKTIGDMESQSKAGGIQEGTLKSYKELRSTIQGLAKPMAAFAKQMREIQEMGAVDLTSGESVTMKRIDIQDMIDKEIGKMKGGEIVRKLDEIMLMARGVVKDAATGMRSDLVNAMNDGSMSGRELIAVVNELETRMKAVGAAALSQETISLPGGLEVSREQGRDITAGIFAEEKGKEMLVRIEQLMEGASDRVKAGATVIKADLQGLLDQGAKGVGGENLRVEINKIITSFNELSGLRPIDLIKSEEIGDAIKLSNAYDVAGVVFKRIMREGTADARMRAGVIKKNIDLEDAAARAGEQSYTAANQKVRKYLGTLKELGGFKIEDPFARLAVGMDTNALRDQMIMLVDKSTGYVQGAAQKFREELDKMLRDPPPADELKARLVEIETHINNLIDKAHETQQISIGPQPGGVSGKGGQRDVLSEARKLGEAQIHAGDLEARVDALMGTISATVTQRAADVKLELQGMFDVDIKADAAEAELSDFLSTVKELEAIEPIGFVEAQEASKVQSVDDEYHKLMGTYNELINLSGMEGAAAVKAHKQAADASRARATGDQANAAKHATNINKMNGKIKEQIKQTKDAQKTWDGLNESILASAQSTDALGVASAKVNLAETYNRLNTVIAKSGLLLQSTNSKAHSVGLTLQNAGEKAKTALDKGDKSAEDINEELQRMEGLANKAGTAFQVNMDKASGSAKRASASLWKVGNALDRTGVRGVGGIIRIIDAFKGLGPAAIGAAVAIGGILIVVTKLIGAVVELGKKAATAFTEFIKGAVETAKRIEITDRHLGALIRRPDLGAGFRDYLLGESFRVGIDLTEDFSRVVVPLAKTTEEIKRAATAAGTLAHAFGETSESISRSFKQAAGGHFRPFQQLFGITPQEIDNIQRLQKAHGTLLGTIEGIEEALQFRGLNLESFEGTLQLIAGRLEVLKTQVRLTVGTPVRDALGEQLENIFKIVEERGPALNKLFAKIGDVVAEVISRAGEFVQALIGDVDDQDLVDLGNAFDTLGEKVSAAVVAITELLTTDDRNVVETIEFLIDKLASLTEKLIIVIEFFEKLQGYDYFGRIPTEEDFQTEEFKALPSQFQGAIRESAAQRRSGEMSEETRDLIEATKAVPAVYDILTQVMRDQIKGTRGLGEDLVLTEKEIEQLNKVIPVLEESMVEGADLLSGADVRGTAARYRPEQARGFGHEDLISGTYEELGGKLLDRINSVMEVADEEVKAGATVIKTDLKGLLDKGADELGGENLRVEINKIITSFNKLSGLEPIDLIERYGKPVAALQDIEGALTDAERAQIAFNDTMADGDDVARNLIYSMEDFQKALETLNEAEAKMAMDRAQREADIRIKFERAKLDDAQKASEDREQLYREHTNDLLELDIDLASDRSKAETDWERKNSASYVKYQDKLTDIDLKATEKKITIEEKFREKLEDIRRKFDLDAEEAIRRNDAVALLRIRRKMRAELEEADIQRKRDIGNATGDAEQQRVDAKVTYDRALRDNNTFLDQKQEDIETADQEKRDEMQRQLSWEKKELEREYKAQRNERKEERKRAFQDLTKDFDDRKEAMTLQYSTEYDIIDYWKGLETTALGAALMEQDSLLMTTYKTWLSYMAPMQSIIAQIYGMGQSQLFNRGPGPWIEGMEGYDPDNPPLWMGGVSQRLLIPPYADVPQGGGDQRLHGGLVTSGNIYGVNERGIEAFMATQAGIVLPREAMMLSPNTNNNGGNVDNSKHLSADIDMMNPNDMSPIMRTMARSILTDEVLNLGF